MKVNDNQKFKPLIQENCVKVLNLSDHLIIVDTGFEIYDEVVEIEVGKLIELPQLIHRLIEVENKHRVKFDAIILPAYTPLISFVLYYFCVIYDFNFKIFVPTKAGTDYYLVDVPKFRETLQQY